MDGDKQLQCAGCGNSFTFTKGEQDFYRLKGFTDPKRCKACRTKRAQEKGQRGNGYTPHGNFN